MQFSNNIISSNWLVQHVVNNTASVISPMYDWINEVSKSITHTIIGTIVDDQSTTSVDDQSTTSGRTVVMITTSIVVCAAALKFLNASYENKKMKEEIKKFENRAINCVVDIIFLEKELKNQTFGQHGYTDNVFEFQSRIYNFTKLIKESNFKLYIDTDNLMKISCLIEIVYVSYEFMLISDIDVDKEIYKFSSLSYQSPRCAYEELLKQIDVLLSLKGENILISDEDNNKTWNALEEKYKDLCSLVNPLPINSKMKSARK